MLTVPNAVTLLRLALLPVYLWLVVGERQLVWGAALLSVIGATDWLDGYLARRLGQVSTVGKVLDPVADRLLFFVGIGGILVVDGAPRWFCIVVVVREVVVSVATVALAALGARRIDVTWAGKAGTFALMFAFPFFLAGSSDLASAPAFWVAGWVAGLPGLALSLWAAAAYVPAARVALRAGRTERRLVPGAARDGVGSPR